MTVLEILEAARAKIADPEHWTQGPPAKNASGRAVATNDSTACAWCGYGAMCALEDDADHHEWIYALKLLDSSSTKLFRRYGGTVSVNEELDHAAVLRVYDHAIVIAKKKALVTA